MKRKIFASFLVLCMIVSMISGLGIGPYSGSAAVRDLRAELEVLYGKEYLGKDTESGTEDMVFVVEPKTWFLTNWNLRNALSLDYKYECKVVITTYVNGSVVSVHTITYQAVDPMGAQKISVRACLDLNSKEETIENK